MSSVGSQTCRTDSAASRRSITSRGYGMQRSFSLDCVVDVFSAVVVPAQQSEVGEVGGSAERPVPDVMRFAEARGHGAAGCGAVAVAGDQGVPLGGGDVAGAAAD